MVSCTIVIPTHNREDLLPRAVRSALAACPADGEVLVVDDKSIVPAVSLLCDIHDQRLRVLVNTGPSGAASSRNFGVGKAQGDVIFFLDDDDELVKDYCLRVLVQGGPASRSEWGYASTVERRADQVGRDTKRVRRRLRRGVVPTHSRPRDLVAAMSDGLWIHRKVMLHFGGLDSEQSVDEDTDLCVRLLGASRWPWYEADPGTIVYRGYVFSRSEGAQLTVATPASRALACYRRSYEKNAGMFGPFSRMRWFLVSRFVRKAVKAGEIGQARDLIDALHPALFRIFARAFLGLKRMAHTNRSHRAQA